MMRLISLLMTSLLLISCLKDDPIKINDNITPENLNDGWSISHPEEEGFEKESLLQAMDYFFSENHLPHSKALLISRHGQLVIEAYSKDRTDRDRLHNIKSVTKSITSVVTGIAIQQGFLSSDLDKIVYGYIPEYFDDDDKKKTITVEHCLRMTTGLEDPFYSVSSVLPGNSLETSLGVRLISTPGDLHRYNNGSANILGGIISTVTTTSFANFTKDNLFRPLQIENYHWVRHNDGRVNPAFDLYMKPRDVLKFGQFCLQNGNWNQTQVLPENWLETSTRSLEDGFDGKFGYHWWISERYSGYYANGHGGQRVFIFPKEELVIVHISEPSTDDTDLTEVETLLDLIMKTVIKKGT